jgi:hypothetical protein
VSTVASPAQASERFVLSCHVGAEPNRYRSGIRLDAAGPAATAAGWELTQIGQADCIGSVLGVSVALRAVTAPLAFHLSCAADPRSQPFVAPKGRLTVQVSEPGSVSSWPVSVLYVQVGSVDAEGALAVRSGIIAKGRGVGSAIEGGILMVCPSRSGSLGGSAAEDRSR